MFPSYFLHRDDPRRYSAISRKGTAGAPAPVPASHRRVIVRDAVPADFDAIVRLAALDDRRVPSGTVVVAEVDGELVAAVSLAGHAIADPFRPTADLVSLLELRATQLRAAEAETVPAAANPRLVPRAAGF
ncbi:MAG: hypothetical protein ACJ76V_14720 [Thermoleophilaceae bacterium]